MILKHPKSGPNGKEDTVGGVVKGMISGGWSLFSKRSIAVQIEHIKEFYCDVVATKLYNTSYWRDGHETYLSDNKLPLLGNQMTLRLTSFFTA